MKILNGHVNEIGDLEHLQGEDGVCSGLVILIDREELAKHGGSFVFEDVAVVLRSELHDLRAQSDAEMKA